MKKYICIKTLIIIILIGCNPSTEVVEVRDEQGRLRETYTIRVSDKLKHGIYVSYYPNGKKQEEATYQADTLHGERRFFYETGDTQFVASVLHGLFDGYYREYHENGKLKQQGQYAKSQMVGNWKTYYNNGQLKEIVPFIDGLENGAFIEYHDNGKLSAEGYKLDGDNDHGKLKLYDRDGKLFREMDCERGRCKTSWLREDQLQDNIQ